MTKVKLFKSSDATLRNHRNPIRRNFFQNRRVRRGLPLEKRFERTVCRIAEADAPRTPKMFDERAVVEKSISRPKRSKPSTGIVISRSLEATESKPGTRSSRDSRTLRHRLPTTGSNGSLIGSGSSGSPSMPCVTRWRPTCSNPARTSA